MPIDITFVSLLGVIAVCFLVGVLFIYIGLYQHYRYLQYLEQEVNQLFFWVHYTLATQQEQIYNLSKTQEFAFHTKKRFFDANQFSVRGLEYCYEQLRKDSHYLAALLEVSPHTTRKTIPRLSLFRVYLLFGVIFLLGSGILLWQRRNA